MSAMGSFAHGLVSSMDERWSEVDLLIETAERFEAAERDGHNVKLQNALKRSAVVLIISHFEGSMREIVKAAIADLNRFSRFRDMPSSIKWNYCNSFFEADTDSKLKTKRIERLMAVFDNANTAVEAESFWLERNRSTSPEQISRLCRSFGIRDFFGLINDSELDVVFQNDRAGTDELLDKIHSHMTAGVYEFPYHLSLDLLGIHKNPNTAGNRRGRTLWEEFLDQVLKERHSIAHGTSLFTEMSAEDIRDQKTKLQILQKVIAMLILHTCGN